MARGSHVGSEHWVVGAACGGCAAPPTAHRGSHQRHRAALRLQGKGDHRGSSKVCGS